MACGRAYEDGKGRRKMLRKVLLACGILSSLLYVAMNVLGAVRFEGYSSISQTVSELSAIGAPSRPVWLALGVPYDLLMIAFGFGVWVSAGGKRTLRVAGGLLIAYGLVGLPWMLLAPMHLRGQGTSLTDTMHIVFTMATVLMMITAMVLGALALARRFRFYTIATIVLLLAFGGLTAKDSPRIPANLPTPLIGVWERINIGVFLLWIVVLAIALLGMDNFKEGY
jgi:hypothetical protein